MTKIYIQKFVDVLSNSGSVGSALAITGSAYCAGYSALVGFIDTSGSSETGSGLIITQSVDKGANWDYVSASDALTNAGSAVYNVGIRGNAVKVSFTAGCSDAAAVRTLFQLRPI